MPMNHTQNPSAPILNSEPDTGAKFANLSHVQC